MSTLKGIRTVNNLVNGNTDAAALETELADPGTFGSWSSLLSQRRFVNRMLETQASWDAVLGSDTALGAFLSSGVAANAFKNNSTRLQSLLSNPTRLAVAIGNIVGHQALVDTFNWAQWPKARDLSLIPAGYGAITTIPSSGGFNHRGSALNSGTLLMSTNNGVGDSQVAYSTDNGQSWTTINVSALGGDNLDASGTAGGFWYIFPNRSNASSHVYRIPLTSGTPVSGSFTAAGTGITQNIYAIGYNGTDAYVALGSSANIYYTSSDGVSWTSRSSASITSKRAVAYSPTLDRWVAVGSGSSGIAYSNNDGQSWTLRSTGNTGQRYDVTWTGTEFVVVGDNFIETSTNGTSWTNQTDWKNARNTVDGRGVEYYNGAVHVSTNNGVIKTTDFSTYEYLPVEETYDSNGYTIFRDSNQSRTIYFPRSGTQEALIDLDSDPDVIRTFRGSITKTGTNNGSSTLINRLASNSKYIFIGTDNNGVAKTSNGTDIMPVGVRYTGNTYSHTPIVGGPTGDIVFMWPESNIHNSYITKSIDGGDNFFVTALNTGLTSTTNPPRGAYGNGIWVVFGNNGDYMRSTNDGDTWSLQTVSSIAGQSIEDVIYQNGKFFAFFGSLAVRTSTDGLSWSDPGDAPTTFSNVVYGNDRFIGCNSSTSYFSYDGTSWVALSVGFFDAWYDQGVWVGSGNNGLIYTSTDGVNFIQSPNDIGDQALRSVRRINGAWLICGNQDTLVTNA